MTTPIGRALLTAENAKAARAIIGAATARHAMVAFDAEVSDAIDAAVAAAIAGAVADKQPVDADLTAIAALTSAADKVPYATGAGAWALANLTAFARTLLAAADDAAARTAIGATATGTAVVTAANEATARDAIRATPSMNVKDYGAVGNNSTNDTVAVQAAIDAAAAIRVALAATKYQNITVHFPPGRYIVGAITLDDGIKLDGDAAILNPPAGFTGTMITLAGEYAQLGENLFIRGNATNGEQAVTVNASCYHNHISSTFQNWGGKVIVDNAGGTLIDSRFIEGMRNDTYINSIAAGNYVGVVELAGSDAGYIIGSEINASRYTYGGTSLGPSTNGVVAALVVSGCNALVYGAVCENGDVGVVNTTSGAFGAPRWNHYISVRAEFCYRHGFLMQDGSGVLNACRAMGNSRLTDDTYDAYHFDGGTWLFTGNHSTSEFPSDDTEHRYGLYKGAGATLLRGPFRSTQDNNAYHDASTSTTYSTVPDPDPNVANINAVDGQRVLKLTANANAVNYLEIISRATGAAAVIAAQGDGNQDIGFQPRGTGGLYWYQPSGGTATLKAQGVAADVGWNLTTKGTGQVQVNGTQVATTADLVFDAGDVGQFWTPPGFSYITGNYYFFTSGATATTSTPTNNRLLLAWVVLPKAVTIQGVFGEITAAGAAGSVMRIGIYNDDGTFKPGSLVLDCGTIAGDSVAVQEITGLNTPLPAGGYWVGGVCQSSGTVPTVRAVATTSQPIPSLFPFGTSLPAAGGGLNAYGASSITGTLPSTIASFTSSGAPRIGFKVA